MKSYHFTVYVYRIVLYANAHSRITSVITAYLLEFNNVIFTEPVKVTN